MAHLKELKAISSNITLLYVEDDEALRKSFTEYLKLIFSSVDTAADGQEGLDLFTHNSYDIVITDIQMPRINGIEMIKAIKEISPDQEIIITTAFSEVPYLLEAISLGASSYLIKPIDFDLINQTLYKIVDKINKFSENERYKNILEEMVEERTQENLALEEEKINNYEKTLLSLVELVEQRDTYTGGHSQRVATYSRLIAEKMGYSVAECDLIYRAGILHDIGKIVTPDAVLLKPGKLDELEYRLIREHAATGASMLKNIPMYVELSKIVAAHHERYDGTGYPNGIKGEEIPKLARIMIVADAFDAMTTNRIYKPRMSIKDAMSELRNLSGIQFHPEVIEASLAVLHDIVVDTGITQLPSSEMENKRFAYFFEDALTKTYNPHYLDLLLVQNQHSRKKYYFMGLFIHEFTAYNNKFSWDQGDFFLKEFADILRQYYRNDLIFRLHGDDFIIMSDRALIINQSIFTELLSVSNNLVTLDFKEFNTDDHPVHSLAELEKLLE
ncbi:MAG: HD domain-containing phosphohydrolase [Pseudomonadota bacterium]